MYLTKDMVLPTGESVEIIGARAENLMPQ